MSLSTILKQECPACGKIAIEASRLTIGKSTIIKLACGHIQSYASQVLEENAYDSIVFSDGKKPRVYQIEAVKFGEAANFSFILADEQGLGKTIEVSSLLRLHPEKLYPAVIVVPTNVKRQWMWELYRILNKDPKEFPIQVIQSGKEKAMPGFKIYLITFDMLKKEDAFEYIPEINTIIIDECQRIKNHLSERAKAVQRIAKKAKNIIPMSGTPIKNHAGEYFTILNLVAPKRFPSFEGYLRRYCDTYETMYGYKVGGLVNPERFHEDTKDIIIRRTKAEVLKDLPSKDRRFHHVELDPKLNKAYAKALQELDDAFYADDVSEFERSNNTLAIMARMRHITGISKVEACVEFVTEFLLSTDRKIVVFVHHQDVGGLLETKLNSYLEQGAFEKVLVLNSTLDSNKRADLIERFKEAKNRVMIASTLAAGEGLNLQFCSDAIMLERQWNPPNEEQAEDRFHRFGQENSVTITYMLASGTIDEYFTELVESKRAMIAATMDNKEIDWQQSNLMKELTETLVTKGRERWRL